MANDVARGKREQARRTPNASRSSSLLACLVAIAFGVRPACRRFFVNLQGNYFAAKAASIAAVTSGESGVVRGSKRLMILPSGPTRNFPKFHLMSPGKGEASPARAT